jgi:hypothetical protein
MANLICKSYRKVDKKRKIALQPGIHPGLKTA